MQWRRDHSNARFLDFLVEENFGDLFQVMFNTNAESGTSRVTDDKKKLYK